MKTIRTKICRNLRAFEKEVYCLDLLHKEGFNVPEICEVDSTELKIEMENIDGSSPVWNNKMPSRFWSELGDFITCLDMLPLHRDAECVLGRRNLMNLETAFFEIQAACPERKESIPSWTNEQLPSESRIMHRDLRFENIICKSGGELFVIDWEQAIVGDVAADLVRLHEDIGHRKFPIFFRRSCSNVLNRYETNKKIYRKMFELEMASFLLRKQTRTTVENSMLQEFLGKLIEI